MFDITITEAAAICGGSVSVNPEKDTELTSIVIDSRAVVPDCLFVAYRGEKADGHRFIASALKNGAACALAEYVPEDADGPVIVCEDVQQALEKIVSAFRAKVRIPVIGITGSVGKTTAKEMVSSVLSRHYRVLKTQGNLNNTIGLPVSLSNIRREHEIAVLEMGINHFGEMDHLGAEARPDIMLYTRIGHAHLEFLGDLDGVFRAKTEVLAHMREDALVIYNGDDPYLARLSCRERKLSYGRGSDCDVRAENVTFDGSGFLHCDIVYRDRRLSAFVKAFGEHMVYAMLEGASAGFAAGLTDDEIVSGMAAFETVGRRFAFQKVGDISLIDDCYNANPDSVMSSIDSLMDLPGRHVCILGEMLELGENTRQMHYDVGKYAKEKGADLLLVSGELCACMAEGYGEGAVLYPDRESLIADLPAQIRKGDAVLVKASLRSNYAEVSDSLKVLEL